MAINKITLRETSKRRFGNGYYDIDDDVRLTYGLYKSLISIRHKLVFNPKHSNDVTNKIIFESD